VDSAEPRDAVDIHDLQVRLAASNAKYAEAPFQGAQHRLPVKMARHAASIEEIEDASVQSDETSVAATTREAAERDAAFERWSPDDDARHQGAPLAATTDSRQRTAFGLAFMLVIGVRPMNRLFRSRRNAAVAEERPRQRRSRPGR
jgi:hypothetical protein